MTYDPYHTQPTQAFPAGPEGVPQQHPYPPAVSGPPYAAAPPPVYGPPYPGYYQPQPPPKKGASTGKVVAIVFASIVGLCLFGGIMVAVSDSPTDEVAATPTAAAPVKPAQASVPPLSPVEPAAPIVMPNVVGQNAAVAGDYLKKLGFTNIEYGSQDELDSWVVLPENWTVKKQSTKKGRKIPADMLIVLTCTKTG